jgi:GNAT superfamily N-acetyltransferase
MSKPPSTSFGATRYLTAMKMGDVPREWLSRLKVLSYGEYAGGMWGWSHHDGSTWCSIIAEGAMSPENFVGWAAITKEEEPIPVVGVYVAEERRGCGYAEDLVNHLLTIYPQPPGDCYAASRYWSEWPRCLARHGLGFKEWL